MHFVVDRPESIRELAHLTDLDEVVVEAGRLMTRGLLPLVLRRALWALRLGGVLTIRDVAGERADFPLYDVAGSQVRQWAIRFLSEDAEAIESDTQSLQFRRRTPVLEAGWSAGVVYSGDAKEEPALRACLRGLLAQPELSSVARPEVVVCGPANGSRGFLVEFPSVTYLPYDTGAVARFPIAAKKNFLMDRLTGPRLLVLHTRIVLEPGALAAIPQEFDIVAPHVHRRTGAGVLEPYLSLCQVDNPLPGQMSRRIPRTVRDVGAARYWRLYEDGATYVDGGAFATTKRLVSRCPLDERLAWMEAEDVEWCVRALVQGYVCEFEPGCVAVSQVQKWRERPALGGLTRRLVPVVRQAKRSVAQVRHLWSRAIGRR